LISPAGVGPRSGLFLLLLHFFSTFIAAMRLHPRTLNAWVALATIPVAAATAPAQDGDSAAAVRGGAEGKRLRIALRLPFRN